MKQSTDTSCCIQRTTGDDRRLQSGAVHASLNKKFHQAEHIRTPAARAATKPHLPNSELDDDAPYTIPPRRPGARRNCCSGTRPRRVRRRWHLALGCLKPPLGTRHDRRLVRHAARGGTDDDGESRATNRGRQPNVRQVRPHTFRENRNRARRSAAQLLHCPHRLIDQDGEAQSAPGSTRDAQCARWPCVRSPHAGRVVGSVRRKATKPFALNIAHDVIMGTKTLARARARARCVTSGDDVHAGRPRSAR